MTLQTIVEDTPERLYVAAAPLIVDSIVTACAKNGRCVLGIVGGRSIPALLDKLLPYAPQLGSIEVFWLDERIDKEKIYPPSLPELAKLHHAGVDIRWYPLQSLHLEPMEVEAKQVIAQLKLFKNPPEFDVIILSAGEDGHVAGLFPGKQTLHSTDQGYIIEPDAPKPPSLRITVSPALLTTAKQAFLLFVGDKQDAYHKFCSSTHVDECPAKLVLHIPQVTVLTSLK